jgi:hypothetical protein
VSRISAGFDAEEHAACQFGCKNCDDMSRNEPFRCVFAKTSAAARAEKYFCRLRQTPAATPGAHQIRACHSSVVHKIQLAIAFRFPLLQQQRAPFSNGDVLAARFQAPECSPFKPAA